MNNNVSPALAQRFFLSITIFVSGLFAFQPLFAQPLNTEASGAVWQDVIHNSTADFQPRHESGYVSVNGKFYLLGGRGNRVLNVFDPATNEWTEASTVPGNNELHHFQAVSFQNKIYLICAFSGGFPEETPVGDIYIYDPTNDKWEIRTDAIPVERRRGAAGAVVYNDHIYIVGGIKNGHTDGWVNWFDRYDPATGGWDILPVAPHERDHFQAVVINNKLFAIAGRKTGFTSLLGDTEKAIDIYNFETGLWETLPEHTNIPTPRAGAANIVIDGKILVAGGESDLNGAHNDVELFDPLNGSWAVLPALNNGRHGIQAVLENGTVYIAGGWGYNGSQGEELQTQESLVYTSAIPRTRPLLLKPIEDVTFKTDTLSLDVDLNNYFQSSDGSAVGFSITLPSPTTIISDAGISESILHITFIKGKSGTDQVRVRALNEGGLYTDDVFNITVKPASVSPPKIVSAIADEKISYNTKLVKVYLGKVFSDENGVENLVYSIPNITNKNIINSAEIIADTLYIFFKPNAIGRTAIYVKATDGDNLFATDVFLLEFVSGTALLPKVKTPLNDLLISKNSSQRSIALTDVFSNVNPGAKFLLSVNNSNSKILSARIIEDSLVLSFTPDSLGKATLTIRATDLSGHNAEDVFNVDIVEPNGSPKFALRINSGGGLLRVNGEKWIADTFFQAGTTFKANGNISGTDNQEIYRTERYGDFSYAIPVPVGKYNLKLHFTELYFTSSGERLFNINIENGQQSIDSFDIFTVAGGNAIAFFRQVDSIDVSDGILNIDFRSIENFAKISAIEVLSIETHKINYTPFVSFSIPDQEMKYEDSTKVVNLYKVFSDDSGSVPLKLTVEEIADSAILSNAIISGLTLSLKKTPLQSGVTSIKIRATDNIGQYAIEEFLLTIKEPAPSRPIVFRALPDINEKMNAAIPAISIGKTFYDNRGADQLVYTVQGISNSNLINKVEIKESLLQISLNKNAFGISTIKLRATDKDGLFAEDEFEIRVINTDTTLLKSIFINAGGSAITGETIQWQVDAWFEGGNSYVYNDLKPANGDSILITERFGTFGYKIPLPQGTYKVKLHFVEYFWRQTGERVFNVDVENGQGRLTEYDIIAKAGAGGVRVIEEFPGVVIKDGLLDINFITVRDNAKISGIEIIQESSSVSKAARSIRTEARDWPEKNFRVYPNPLTGNTVYIDIPQDFAGPNTNITLLNMQGAVVYKLNAAKIIANSIAVQMPAGLAKGTYLVVLKKDNNSKILKLIVQ